MKLERSKLLNLVINIVAIGVVLGIVYVAVAYILIPVSKYVWTASITSARNGYQQVLLMADTFMQPDKALYLLLGLAIYLLPALIAFKKRVPNRRSILFVNTVFGWSFIGWILALIWCLSAEKTTRNQQS